MEDPARLQSIIHAQEAWMDIAMIMTSALTIQPEFQHARTARLTGFQECPANVRRLWHLMHGKSTTLANAALGGRFGAWRPQKLQVLGLLPRPWISASIVAAAKYFEFIIIFRNCLKLQYIPLIN